MDIFERNDIHDNVKVHNGNTRVHAPNNINSRGYVQQPECISINSDGARV